MLVQYAYYYPDAYYDDNGHAYDPPLDLHRNGALGVGAFSAARWNLSDYEAY